MNVYIYDDFLKKHPKTVSNIEVSLNNLNLGGKIIHLENLKNISNIIKEEIASGAKTIVAVGNNQTFFRVLNATMPHIQENSNLALAIIPAGDNNSLAKALGIKNEKEAAEIILARRIEKIDIPQANDYYFLSQINLDNTDSSIVFDNYSISPVSKGQIKILNLPLQKCSTQNILPQDGKLDLIIEGKGKQESFFKVESLSLENLNKKALVDETTEISCPIKVKIGDKKINLIVGKNRLF